MSGKLDISGLELSKPTGVNIPKEWMVDAVKEHEQALEAKGELVDRVDMGKIDELYELKDENSKKLIDMQRKDRRPKKTKSPKTVKEATFKLDISSPAKAPIFPEDTRPISLKESASNPEVSKKLVTSKIEVSEKLVKSQGCVITQPPHVKYKKHISRIEYLMMSPSWYKKIMPYLLKKADKNHLYVLLEENELENEFATTKGNIKGIIKTLRDKGYLNVINDKKDGLGGTNLKLGRLCFINPEIYQN